MVVHHNRPAQVPLAAMVSTRGGLGRVLPNAPIAAKCRSLPYRYCGSRTPNRRAASTIDNGHLGAVSLRHFGGLRVQLVGRTPDITRSDEHGLMPRSRASSTGRNRISTNVADIAPLAAARIASAPAMARVRALASASRGSLSASECAATGGNRSFSMM
jgi:hypothetical protein